MAAARGWQFSESTYATPYECGLMSSSAYRSSVGSDADTNREKLSQLGWCDYSRVTVDGSILPKSREIGAIEAQAKAADYCLDVHINVKRKIIVLAFRGTKTTSDFLTDLYRIAKPNEDKLSAQEKWGDAITKLLAEVVKIPSYSGYRVCFTGHSLGAWLAQRQLYLSQTPSKAEYIASAHAITFDCPPAEGIVRSLDSHVVFESEKATKLNLLSYLSWPNLVNTYGGKSGNSRHLGAVYQLQPANVDVSKSYWSYTVASHGIDNIISALSSETGYPDSRLCFRVVNWPLVCHERWQKIANIADSPSGLVDGAVAAVSGLSQYAWHWISRKVKGERLPEKFSSASVAALREIIPGGEVTEARLTALNEAEKELLDKVAKYQLELDHNPDRKLPGIFVSKQLQRLVSEIALTHSALPMGSSFLERIFAADSDFMSALKFDDDLKFIQHGESTYWTCRDRLEKAVEAAFAGETNFITSFIARRKEFYTSFVDDLSPADRTKLEESMEVVTGKLKTTKVIAEATEPGARAVAIGTIHGGVHIGVVGSAAAGAPADAASGPGSRPAVVSAIATKRGASATAVGELRGGVHISEGQVSAVAAVGGIAALLGGRSGSGTGTATPMGSSSAASSDGYSGGAAAGYEEGEGLAPAGK